MSRIPRIVVAALAVAALLACAPAAGAKSRKPAAKPTIVLVHGAWADGSSWSGVVRRLQRDGYTVDVPPNPLRGLAADAASLSAFLGTLHGPIVLVGHSYGGAVISNAATGNSQVKSLVFVDAFMPDTGETVLGLSAARPGSALAADPATVFDMVPIPGAPADVDLYIKPSLFPSAFANDLPRRKAAVLAAVQRPAAISAFMAPSGEPAWKTIPSWAFIGTADHVLPPAEQRFMAKRAGSRTVAMRTSHLAMVSHPGAVTRLIRRAAKG